MPKGAVYKRTPIAKSRVGAFLVGRTGFEPVTFSVSGRRAPAAPTARDDESLPEPRVLCALARLAPQGRRERGPRLAGEREDRAFPVLLGVADGDCGAGVASLQAVAAVPAGE